MLALLPLAVVPLSAALRYLVGASPFWVFATASLGVMALAYHISEATERVAETAGPAIGGLLNVSFGSVAELVLAVFVLADGQAAVVRAQITGSIIGTGLLGLGLAILVGGLTRERQTFKRERAGLLSSLLIVVLIALLLPAVFDMVVRADPKGADVALSDEHLSLGVSAVLLALYAGNLVYTLITHRDVFSRGGGEAKGEGGRLWLPLGVMVGGTAVLAFEAELVSGALEATAAQLHLSPLFLGVVVLALVGTSADLFAAALFAHRDRMGLVMDICIGSAIQVALVVAPLLVVVSFLLGHPMTLVFGNPLDLFAIAATAFAVNAVAGDGVDDVVRGSAARRRLRAAGAGLPLRGVRPPLRSAPARTMQRPRPRRTPAPEEDTTWRSRLPSSAPPVTWAARCSASWPSGAFRPARSWPWPPTARAAPRSPSATRS